MLWKWAGVIGLTLIAVLAIIYLPYPWNIIIGPLATVFAFASAISATSHAGAFTSAVAAVIPLLSALAATMYNFNQIGRAVGWVKPTYAIAIDHPVIVLGEVAQATLVGSYADGSKANLDGFRCNWQLSRVELTPQHNGECTVAIQNAVGTFHATDPESLIVSISLEVTPPSGASIKIADPNKFTLTMHNRSVPIVSISPPILEIGQTAAAKFRFATGVVPSNYTCSWTPAEQFLKPTDCEATFVAPESSGQYRDGVVPVHVIVSTNGLTLQSEVFNVSVQQPPAQLYDFVLDATDNMAPVYNGVTLFDSAKKDIASQVARFGPRGGWLSITAFGQDVAAAKDDCDRYGQIYPLAPINPQAAVNALGAVHMVGHVAPLAKAIDSAVAEYSALRPTYAGKEVSTYFVMIAASANGCLNMPLADAIAELATAFERHGLKVQYYGKSLFSVVVVVRIPGGVNPDEIAHGPGYQSERNNTVLIVAENGAQVADIVNSIVNMSDEDAVVRHNGCKRLSDYLVKGDSKGYTIIKQRCSG